MFQRVSARSDLSDVSAAGELIRGKAIPTGCRNLFLPQPASKAFVHGRHGARSGAAETKPKTQSLQPKPLLSQSNKPAASKVTVSSVFPKTGYLTDPGEPKNRS